MRCFLDRTHFRFFQLMFAFAATSVLGSPQGGSNIDLDGFYDSVRCRMQTFLLKQEADIVVSQNRGTPI